MRQLQSPSEVDTGSAGGGQEAAGGGGGPSQIPAAPANPTAEGSVPEPPSPSPDPARRLTARIVAAGVTVAALLALLACDIWVAPVRVWWDQHSLTTDSVSSLLVVGVTALLFDEIVARRQRRERSLTVAVQALILYGQAARTYSVVPQPGDPAQQEPPEVVRQEVRNLVNMILVASPALFDDPEARPFLEEVQRLAGLMYETLGGDGSAGGQRSGGSDALGRLRACRSRVDQRVRPLATRVPVEDRGRFEGLAGPEPARRRH